MNDLLLSPHHKRNDMEIPFIKGTTSHITLIKRAILQVPLSKGGLRGVKKVSTKNEFTSGKLS